VAIGMTLFLVGGCNALLRIPSNLAYANYTKQIARVKYFSLGG
jgi:hypothetical protein